MLTDMYPPIVGGVEQHVRSLSAELTGRGHEVAVATLWHEGLAEYEPDDIAPSVASKALERHSGAPRSHGESQRQRGSGPSW